MNKRLRLFFLVGGLLIIFSCKTTRKAEKPIVIKHGKSLEEIGADMLLKNIHDSAFYGKWISAKASVNATIDNDKNSFNINMRMCRDSAIWVSVSPLLGIEAVRVLLTPDTVRFLDRINHEYKVSGYKLINDLLNSEILILKLYKVCSPEICLLTKRINSTLFISKNSLTF